MTDGDLIVERGAESLEHLARRAEARQDGVGELVAEELDASARFVRKLKPSLIMARIRDRKKARPGARRRKGSGPAPILIVGGALIVGMLAARLIDATTDDGD